VTTPPPPPDRRVARSLARESIARGDPTGWFEELYARAETEPGVVPWASLAPNPLLVTWTPRRFVPGPGARALVVGCGYGDDAEWLTSRGLDVTAFDISATAVAMARRRFPHSTVSYAVGDALRPPRAWREAFDLVVESYTLQVLPPTARAEAARGIASCARGTLLMIARGREEDDDPGMLPWPLTRAEIEAIAREFPRLQIVQFEDLMDDEDPPVRRFRVELGNVPAPTYPVRSPEEGDRTDRDGTGPSPK